jgi:hypothetical protein
MPDDNEAFVAITTFLRERYVSKTDVLRPSSTLFGDLHLWGDDAAELFERLRDRFGVDISEFEYDRHFLPEAYSCLELLFLPIVVLLRLWRRHVASGTPEDSEGFIPITVQQLAEAVRMRRWPGEWSRSLARPASDA